MKFVAEKTGFTLDVELSISAHERIALVGPNGAGKSSLLQQWILQGGSSCILLGQKSQCFPHLSVLDNVAFAPRAQGKTKTQARVVAQELLHQAGLAQLAGEMPGTLSGGQQQRIALLRALATGASTVLLDEPLTGLDVQAVREYRQLLLESKQIQQLVIAAHDPSDVAQLAQRVVVLDGGNLVADMPSSDFFALPPNNFSAQFVDCNRVESTEVLWFYPSDVRVNQPGRSAFEHQGVVRFVDALPQRTRIGIDLGIEDSSVIVAEIVGATELSPGETCMVRVDDKHLRRGQSINVTTNENRIAKS